MNAGDLELREWRESQLAPPRSHRLALLAWVAVLALLLALAGCATAQPATGLPLHQCETDTECHDAAPRVDPMPWHCDETGVCA